MPERAVLAPGAWGPTRGPDPISRFTWHGRDSPGTFGPHSSRAGVQLTSLPPPLGGRSPAGSPRPRSLRGPHPPTPLPPPSKVSRLFCLRIFCKVSVRSPGVGRNAGALTSDALPRLPAAPGAGPGRRERPPPPGHRPRSAAPRRPLLAPCASARPSGCLLPVPRVLIPLLMNILTEANAGEN